MNKFRILVCGGRHFEDYNLLKTILDKVLKLKKLTPRDVEIVSGHCKGADLLGERWAEEMKASVKVFPADWLRYKKSAGPIRNKQMIDYITCFNDKLVVAFVSPNSKGTKYTIKLAQKNNISVITTEYSKKEKNMKNKITYNPPESNASEEEKAFANSIANMLIDLVDLDDEDIKEIENESKKYCNLHTEMHQIILSKKELYWQLNNFDIQDHLFDLFTTDKNSHKYARLLNLLGVKFELIGAFNYVSKVGGEKHLAKPPISTYYRYIFDSYCESAEEVRTKIYTYSPEHREMLFKKYRAVRYYITPMLATTSEQNYTAMFMGILDYVAKNDDFPETTFDGDFCYPDVLRDRVKDFDWWSHDVHR